MKKPISKTGIQKAIEIRNMAKLNDELNEAMMEAMMKASIMNKAINKK